MLCFRQFFVLLVLITLRVRGQCPTLCTCPSAHVASCASLTELPADRFDINLQFLDVSDNLLRSLEETSLTDIGLASLVQLNASGNQITDIHEEAFLGLKKLQVVDLSSNQLTFIAQKTFTHNPSLNILSLSNNRGLEMPKQGYFLSSAYIGVLDLSNCNINNIPPKTFQKLPNLQKLDISHNSIEILFPLQGVERLTKLDLNHNYLRHLESTIFSASPKLIYLNLSYNMLSALNAAVMPQLAEVSRTEELNGNPWVCDCAMFNTVYSWCRENGVDLMLVCASPPKFKGKPWTTYDETGCDKDITDNEQPGEEYNGYGADDNSDDTAQQVEETYHTNDKDITDNEEPREEDTGYGADDNSDDTAQQVEKTYGTITEIDEKLLRNTACVNNALVQAVECCEICTRQRNFLLCTFILSFLLNCIILVYLSRRRLSQYFHS